MKNVFMEHWNLVMDSRYNPLRHMGLASQHYYMMILACMWSMVFTFSFFSIAVFHYVWGAHLLVVGGLFFTAAVFQEGEKTRKIAVRVDGEQPGTW